LTKNRRPRSTKRASPTSTVSMGRPLTADRTLAAGGHRRVAIPAGVDAADGAGVRAEARAKNEILKLKDLDEKSRSFYLCGAVAACH